MPLIPNTNYNNPCDPGPSASYPHGVGVGWAKPAPGWEIKPAPKQDGQDRYRVYEPSTDQGRREVRMLTSDKHGNFGIRVGTNGDKLNVRINVRDKTWWVETGRANPEHPQVVDPKGFIEPLRGKIAAYVAGMLGEQSLATGPTRAPELEATWSKGRYVFVAPPGDPSAAKDTMQAPTKNKYY
jgi:hypothetical protein